MKRISTISLPPPVIATSIAAFFLAGTLLAGASLQTAYADDTQSGKGSTTVVTTQSDAASVAKVSGKWEKWPSGWYFKKKDGSYATGFIQPNSDTRVYYLNGKGLMKTGWIKVGDKWYWAKSNGALHSGWKKLKGKWYYLDPKVPTHPAVTGFFSDGKARYYTHPASCAMKTGWIKVGNTWYWAKSSGALSQGWLDYKGNRYYLDPNDTNYAMRTGLFTPANSQKQYYANSSGKVLTSQWVISGGKTYFASSTGELSTFDNFTYKNKAIYGVDDTGNPIEGWYEQNNIWFYSTPGTNGKLATGWCKIEGSWYYFDANCAMATGWRKVGGAWYYLSPKDGKMYSSGWKWIDDVDYKFSSGGKMVGAWMDVPCYYQNPELPTGCESVALTNALRYYGFKLSKTTIADSYLPRSDSNFVTAFTGNPHSSSGGQTCAPGIVNAANKYLAKQGSSLRAHEITGTSMAKLCTNQLASGRPVIIWASIGYSYGGAVYASQTYKGRTYNAFSLSHTMVLCGYDDEKGVVWLSDSISGRVRMPYSQVKSLYTKHGSQAVVMY